MIEVLKQYSERAMSYRAKVNVIREMLQILILKVMGEVEIGQRVAFVGGTALRILYDVRRFSEDLDFSLIEGNSVDCAEWAAHVKRALNLYGIRVETSMETEGTVQNIEIKFPGMFYELGLSDHKNEKLMIKWDVDMRPPAGAAITRSIVQKTVMFTVLHYDLPSLFAGKLHACLYRKYVKGRDWYDFIWFMGQHVEPNYELLNNAIDQTHGAHERIANHNIRQVLGERVAQLNFKSIKDDVERFLEDARELSVFDTQAMLNLIEKMPVSS